MECLVPTHWRMPLPIGNRRGCRLLETHVPVRCVPQLAYSFWSDGPGYGEGETGPMMTCVLRRTGFDGKRRDGMSDGPKLVVKHLVP